MLPSFLASDNTVVQIESEAPNGHFYCGNLLFFSRNSYLDVLPIHTVQTGSNHSRGRQWKIANSCTVLNNTSWTPLENTVGLWFKQYSCLNTLSVNIETGQRIVSVIKCLDDVII